MDSTRFKYFLQLSKPNITKLVLVTTAIGYCMAAKGLGDPLILFLTLVGTAFTCGGSAALNNYLEKDYDCLMKRTAKRALPTGKVKLAEALGFGLIMVLIGTALLVLTVNLLTGFLALLTAFLYVLVYTPLKRHTWLNTFIGAIPGALPPLGGWAAFDGTLGWGGWTLFIIMFMWQMPHFYSIAWMYKDDYAKAGYKMISLNDPSGKKTFTQSIIFTLFLLLASLLPVYSENIGFTYIVAAALLGTTMLAFVISAGFSRTRQAARMVLHTSIIYLPLLFSFLLIDSFY